MTFYVNVFQAPFWAYILGALGLFIYQSLDAIDGKQARRTNSSSPLGELFDHGCDSISTGSLNLLLLILVLKKLPVFKSGRLTADLLEVGKDLWRSPSPPSCSEQGQDVPISQGNSTISWSLQPRLPLTFASLTSVGEDSSEEPLAGGG